MLRGVSSQAGLRTHMLVSMASALFTIVSQHGFSKVVPYSTGYSGDLHGPCIDSLGRQFVPAVLFCGGRAGLGRALRVGSVTRGTQTVSRSQRGLTGCALSGFSRRCAV